LALCCLRDLAHCKSILKQRSRFLQHRRTQVTSDPPNAIRFVVRNLVELRLKRHRGITLHPIPELLEMYFKSCALLRRVILWSSQCDYRVESVFSSRRTPLPTICARVMYQQNRDALPQRHSLAGCTARERGRSL
jgi:hypothetical protein